MGGAFKGRLGRGMLPEWRGEMSAVFLGYFQTNIMELDSLLLVPQSTK